MSLSVSLLCCVPVASCIVCHELIEQLSSFCVLCRTNQYIKILLIGLMIKLGEKTRQLMVALLGWLCNELWWQSPNVSTINTIATMPSQFHPFANHTTCWPVPLELSSHAFVYVPSASFWGGYLTFCIHFLSSPSKLHHKFTLSPRSSLLTILSDTQKS